MEGAVCRVELGFGEIKYREGAGGMNIHGSQNSLKFCLCNEEMNRTISSADFRHSVWKYRRASGFSVSALLTSCGDSLT